MDLDALIDFTLHHEESDKKPERQSSPTAPSSNLHPHPATLTAPASNLHPNHTTPTITSVPASSTAPATPITPTATATPITPIAELLGGNHAQAKENIASQDEGTPDTPDTPDALYGFYNSDYAHFTTLSDIHCVEHRVPKVKLRHQDHTWCVLCHRAENERALQQDLKKHHALEAELKARGITYREWVVEMEEKKAQQSRKELRGQRHPKQSLQPIMSIKATEDHLEQLMGFSAYAFDQESYRPLPIEKSAKVIRRIIHPDVHYFRKSVGLLFYGAPHTGKTISAFLIIRTWARLGKQVHYLTFNDLRNQLASEGFKTREACLRTCKNAEILVIDDIDYPRLNLLLASEIKNLLHYRTLRLGITILITRADCSTLPEWSVTGEQESTSKKSNKSRKAKQPRELVNIDTAKLKQFKLVPFGDNPYPYTQPHSEPHADSYPDAYSDSYPDAYSDSYPDSCPDPYPDSYSNDLSLPTNPTPHSLNTFTTAQIPAKKPHRYHDDYHNHYHPEEYHDYR